MLCPSQNRCRNGINCQCGPKCFCSVTGSSKTCCRGSAHHMFNLTLGYEASIGARALPKALNQTPVQRLVLSSWLSGSAICPMNAAAAEGHGAALLSFAPTLDFDDLPVAVIVLFIYDFVYFRPCYRCCCQDDCGYCYSYCIFFSYCCGRRWLCCCCPSSCCIYYC